VLIEASVSSACARNYTASRLVTTRNFSFVTALVAKNTISLIKSTLKTFTKKNKCFRVLLSHIAGVYGNTCMQFVQFIFEHSVYH